MIEKNDDKKYFSETQRFYNRLFENDDHYGAQEYLHGWAGNFHRYRVQLLRNIFINILKCKKDTEILDVGSHLSIFGQVFSPNECPRVTAIDISDVIVEKIKKTYPQIKPIVDNAQNPAIVGKWDILFAGDIIEHLPNPSEALVKWDNLIKDNGYLFISTPNRYFSRKTKEHISLVSIGEIKKMLGQLDYKIVEIIGIDLFIPFSDRLLHKISKHFSRLSPLTDRIFQLKMRSTLNYPWLARNVIYIARKG